MRTMPAHHKEPVPFLNRGFSFYQEIVDAAKEIKKGNY
jgi:hypothetical protein